VDTMFQPSVQVFGIAVPLESRKRKKVRNQPYFEPQVKVIPEPAEFKKTLIISGFPLDWSVQQVRTAVTSYLNPIANQCDFGVHESSQKTCESGICVIDFSSHAQCYAALMQIEKLENDALCVGLHKWGKNEHIKRKLVRRKA